MTNHIFRGTLLGDDNEINGLTLGGVGSGTKQINASLIIGRNITI